MSGPRAQQRSAASRKAATTRKAMAARRAARMAEMAPDGPLRGTQADRVTTAREILERLAARFRVEAAE